MLISTYSVDSGFTGATTNKVADASAQTAGADYQTFLTLLTAQLRNQDPLKPLESTDFVAQLASFSAVEQQVRTNDQLAAIAALLASSGTDGLAEMVGQSVRAPTGALWAGDPVDVYWTAVGGAETQVLKVFDSGGALVDQQILSGSADQAQWQGPTAGGGQAQAGIYRFAVESSMNGAIIDTQTGLVEAEIVEVRYDSSNAKFLFADGTIVAAADVM